MSGWPSPTPPLEEIIRDSGIAHPNGTPYSHITFALVAWNEEERLGPLLEKVRPYFESIVVGVQESTDGTLAIAHEWADSVVEDAHLGFGDATFGPKVLPRVRTPWALKLDADEWPSDDLLSSLSSATWYADHSARTTGVWIPFRSSVDGIEYEEQHSHLRLFHASAGWPAHLHSTPPIHDGVLWGSGYIRHDRSMNELVRDYMRYLSKSDGNPGWIAHNEMMIRSACTGTAAVKGWDYVKSHEWWPQVETIVGKES